METLVEPKSFNQHLSILSSLTCLLVLLLFISMFWEHKEISLALAAGNLDILLAHPGRFMNASLIVASGITLLSFGALYFCNYAIAESTMYHKDAANSLDLETSLKASSKPKLQTSLAIAAKEFRLAEEAKNRALEAAIAREREFVVELLGAGLAELAGGGLGFRMTASYGEYQQLEADFNAALYQLGAVEAVKHNLGRI